MTNKIINKHKHLVLTQVARMAPRCLGRGIDKDDLYQEGMLALVQCADDYHVHRDYFPQWCMVIISRRISRYVRANTTPLTTPINAPCNPALLRLTYAKRVGGQQLLDGIASGDTPPNIDTADAINRLQAYLTQDDLDLLTRRLVERESLRVLAHQHRCPVTTMAYRLSELISLARLILGDSDNV